MHHLHLKLMKQTFIIEVAMVKWKSFKLNFHPFVPDPYKRQTEPVRTHEYKRQST